MTTHPKSRVQAGVREGGQFATTERAESDVRLDDERDALEERAVADEARWAGVVSMDDFGAGGRERIEQVGAHAYRWAEACVGSLGMETPDYAEDYAAWVTRRYMTNGLDDESLGEHGVMVKQWDAERAANAARQVASTPDERAWVESMAQGKVLRDGALGTGGEGVRRRRDFAAFDEALERRGVVVERVTSASGSGWTITSLNADRFGVHVATTP